MGENSLFQFLEALKEEKRDHPRMDATIFFPPDVFSPL
jgi:hypothetical protein